MVNFISKDHVHPIFEKRKKRASLIYFKTNQELACSNFIELIWKAYLLRSVCLALLNHDNRLEQSLQRSSFNINSIECTALQLLTTLYFFLGLHQQLNIHFIYMLHTYTRKLMYTLFFHRYLVRSRSTLSLHVLALYNRAGGKGGVSFFLLKKLTFHSVKIILRAERRGKSRKNACPGTCNK